MAADDQQGRFAIHAACREGQTHVVASLLQTDPSLVSRRDDDDRVPLHWAASYNRLEIIQLLSETTPSTSSTTSRRGTTSAFDINATDGSGWTALMMASSLSNSLGESLVSWLLSHSADASLKTSHGQTALHLASSKGNLDVARLLLQHGASARVKDSHGRLPLHRAAAVGNVPMIKLMLENKSPLNSTDADGSTALHHAVAEGHGDAAVVLLKAGAESDKVDASGALAIDLAPDAKVRSYILRVAEEEGIDVTTKTS